MRDVRAVRTPVDDDLRRAADVVARELEPSPVVASPRLGDGVVLKLETLQPTGSFKVRGGLAALSRAAEDGVSVIAASAGNHGLGVAYGAARFGVPATVVVPENASAKKVQALQRVPLHARAPWEQLRRRRATRPRARGGRPGPAVRVALQRPGRDRRAVDDLARVAPPGPRPVHGRGTGGRWRTRLGDRARVSPPRRDQTFASWA